ncbi:cache domain-containing protein [Malaciobacter marinus]|uniref:cache domain-containing protein n=1 Tax=Malaciobacter marinus TaxID=505249 RepID=UPI003B000A08
MTKTISVSMRTKVLIISIFVVFFLAVASLIATIVTVNTINKSNIDEYKHDIYKKTEIELQNYVQVTIQTIDSFYKRTLPSKIKQEVKNHLTQRMDFLFSILEENYKIYKNSMSKEELKQHLIKIIKSAKYSNSGYFWVNDFDAIMIMHPILEELNNQNLMDQKDENGKELFKAFVHVAKKQNAGFVDYLWPKPGMKKAEEKISYVKVFEPFNWIIGTGDYVQEVTNKIKKDAIKTISEIRYGNNGYFWINNSKSKMISHPIFKDLNGKNLSTFQDENGQYIFNEFVTIANEKKEGGLVLYLWPKPGEQKAKPKISYVQKFQPWDWIIGTGAYVDEIELKIKNMEEKSEKSLQTITILSAIIFVIVLIILSLITLTLSTKRDDKDYEEEYL